MTIPIHFARYLSGFQPSRVREDFQMTSMPICLACHRAMTVLYSLNADGERMLRAECPSCGDIRVIPASRASASEASNGVSSQTPSGADKASGVFGECAA